MYELLIKESEIGLRSASQISSTGGGLISLLIQFHKIRDEFPNCIILLHQRIRFSRIKANNYLLLRFRIDQTERLETQRILTQKLKQLGGNISRVSIF
jgi:hypothetical protein|uniref:Uncharacterized protein n=1 Tax=Diphylleia rotans TaxID=190327 RepID=A0A146I6Y5_9EUKA|nr:hypothetical protein A5449_gp30 [Diphylleia rotans]BAU71452.1 hypothetical protein [Diphylleia rotans]